MKTISMVALVLVAGVSLGLTSSTLSGQTAGHASASGMHDTKPSGAAINIDNFSFTPATLTVSAGTSVTWTNHDDIPHTIVEHDQKFKSKGLDTDDSFSYTFSEAGTYEYFCGLHPKMVGKIIVEMKK
jgi:plastocyanin